MSGFSWRAARFTEYRNTGAGAAINGNRPQMSASRRPRTAPPPTWPAPTAGTRSDDSLPRPRSPSRAPAHPTRGIQERRDEDAHRRPSSPSPPGCSPQGCRSSAPRPRSGTARRPTRTSASSAGGTGRTPRRTSPTGPARTCGSGSHGKTVKLRQRNTIDFYASIDGGRDVLPARHRQPHTDRSAGRNHTLRVSYRVVAGSYHGDAVFRGLALEAAPRRSPRPAPRCSSSSVTRSPSAPPGQPR